ncbi:AUX/IAA domain [Dillenia turbinata]|uniref:Auxin-responsive protein n=1 Tax=Dillenia turbinata TaxID=194707 RepID=A0AAN8UG44_9MAGN
MSKQGLEVEIITELRLGLPGNSLSSEKNEKKKKKRVFDEMVNDEGNSSSSSHERKNENIEKMNNTQVVGWPPVCSYRKKLNQYDSKIYVKISMDGVPFLRKIDLGNHKDYPELALAFEKLFGCHGIREALKDADNSEYIPIYEDKDGDWMLVGDVPWE